MGFGRQTGRKTIKEPSFSSIETAVLSFPNLSDGEVQREEQFFPTRQLCGNIVQPLSPKD